MTARDVGWGVDPAWLDRAHASAAHAMVAAASGESPGPETLQGALAWTVLHAPHDSALLLPLMSPGWLHEPSPPWIRRHLAAWLLTTPPGAHGQHGLDLGRDVGAEVIDAWLHRRGVPHHHSHPLPEIPVLSVHGQDDDFGLPSVTAWGVDDTLVRAVLATRRGAARRELEALGQHITVLLALHPDVAGHLDLVGGDHLLPLLAVNPSAAVRRAAQARAPAYVASDPSRSLAHALRLIRRHGLPAHAIGRRPLGTRGLLALLDAATPGRHVLPHTAYLAVDDGVPRWRAPTHAAVLLALARHGEVSLLIHAYHGERRAARVGAAGAALLRERHPDLTDDADALERAPHAPPFAVPWHDPQPPAPALHVPEHERLCG